MTRGHLFVVAAPSGAGKTSLMRALMQRLPKLSFSVSCTTRGARANEVDGHDYFFVSHEEFQRRVAAGAFIEHAEVFGNLYGTLREQVEAALAEGRDLILEIDWQGARQVRERLPEAIHVFILPPSRQVLEQRLRSRRTDSEAAIARRLADSVEEMGHWLEYDYVVVNQDFDTSLAELEAIFSGQGSTSRSDRPGLSALMRELTGPAPAGSDGKA